MKCGSLFTGIEGLDMAVTEFFGAEVAWVSEVEKPLLDRFTVPNLGDVTQVDWSEVEPVDILCGGYPCQPFSSAGQRRGFDDPRDLWPHFARAIRILRPSYVVAENVAGHLRLGFERTLRDLAEMGFDARWGVVRASDAGAPHRRERIFCLAWDASSHPGRGLDGEPERFTSDTLGQSVRDRQGSVGSPQRTGEGERSERQRVRADDFDGGSGAPTDPRGNGLHRGQEQARGAGRDQGRRGQGTRWHNADGCDVGLAADSEVVGLDGAGTSRNGWSRPSDFDFGPYEPAIRRWERVLNRPAPKPIDDQNRLTPAFVEWMQGMPAGHVDGLSRTQALKALGNSVVPQQAYLALKSLI